MVDGRWRDAVCLCARKGPLCGERVIAPVSGGHIDHDWPCLQKGNDLVVRKFRSLMVT